MATTINSGYANSPKLTANIADHADVYGGRALVFDGVTDYLEVDQTFTTDNFALSFWINPDNVTNDKYLFDQNAGICRSVVIGYQNGYINFINDDDDAGNYYPTGTETDTQIPVSVGEWQHYVMMTDGTKVYGYRNGAEIVNITGKWGASGAEKLWIGKYENGLHYEGKMTDVKIFDTVLTEAQVQELYKKPENTPIAVQNNLVAWYPMIEGNPESPQSIVYDHSEKKLGSELSNKDFTGWTLDGSSNWSASSATSLSHTASSAGFASSPFSTVSGKIYKVSITINSGQTGTYKLQLGASSWLFDPTDGNDTWSGNHIFYVSNAGSSSNGFKIYASSSFVGTFTDVSVKEVQMGNHATTNFFGDMSDVLSSTQKTNMDAILESDDNNFDFSDTAGNQVTQSTLGSEVVSGSDWAVDSGITVSSGSLVFNTSTQFNKAVDTTAVSGKVYKTVFTISNYTSGSVKIRIGAFGEERSGNGTYTEYITSTTANVEFYAYTDGSNDFTIENISVKEITTTKFFPLFGSDEINGNTLQLTNAGTTKAHVALPFTTVVGKSYNAEIKLTTANMSGGLSVSDDIAENTLSTASSSGSIITSNTFVATGTTSYVHIKNNQANNNQYNLYDNLKVREVGVSSSGFDTAINQPVVPQVPLMRYNQKIFFNGNNGSGTEVLWNNIGGVFASSEFTLSVVHLGRDIDETITIFDITESAYTDYIRLFRSNDGRYYVYIENANSSQTIYEYASYADNADFHHIVLTCDGSKWCFYINGYKEREESNTHTTAHLNLSTTDMRVGMIGTGSESYRAVGIIDELSLWNTALTYDEVKELYADSVVKDATTHSKKDNLLGYWRNDGVTTWKDRSTNSNDGTVQGSPDSITIREGLNSNRDGLGFYFTNPSNNVLRLNGVDEYLVTPDTDLSLSEQITIECWAKNNSDNLATDEYLAEQYETALGANRSWLFRMLSDEKLRVVWSSNGTNYSFTSTSSAITNVNTWRHYVATIASGVAKIYVDGEIETIDSVTSSGGLQTSLHNSVSNIFVGRYANDNNTNWNGLIDEVKIYNRALSLAEIQKNYKHQKGKHKND